MPTSHAGGLAVLKFTRTDRPLPRRALSASFHPRPGPPRLISLAALVHQQLVSGRLLCRKSAPAPNDTPLSLTPQRDLYLAEIIPLRSTGGTPPILTAVLATINHGLDAVMTL